MRGEPAALEGIKQLQRASLPTIRVCVLAHRPGSSYWPSRCIRRVCVLQQQRRIREDALLCP